MDASKQFLKDNDIVSFISFKEKAQHTVTLISDELDEVPNNKGEMDPETNELKMVKGISYMVEEDGEKRKFFTSSNSLIQKLSQYKVGSTLTIEMKSKQGPDKKWKSFFVVKEEGEPEDASEDDGRVRSEDIPF